MLENETNPVTFSCQATGEPVPTISWHFNGVMVNESDTSEYNISDSTNGNMITSSLTIMNAQSSDVGIYTCHAENIIGIDRSSGILTVQGKDICSSYEYDSSYLHYNITDSAEILEPSEDMVMEYVIEGGNITLRCVGVGYPPPLVQWRKLNESSSDRVSSSNMLMSTNEGNVTRVTVDLVFTGVYRDDTGVYECLSSNLLNIVTRSVLLTVQCMYIYVFTCMEMLKHVYAFII